MSAIRLLALTMLSSTAAVQADVVVSVSADVLAEFDGTPVIDTSTVLTDSIVAFSSAQNSFTQSEQDWAYDATTSTLTGRGEVEAKKSVSAKPGGVHRGTTSLVFDFEIDSTVDYSLNGSFGFSNVINGTDDSISYVLSGPGGTIVSGSTTSTTGIASDPFSHSGTLLNDSGTGTTLYTLTFSSVLNETLNNEAAVIAGWNIAAFTIATSAPEPSAVALMLPIGLVLCFRRGTRGQKQP